MLQTSYPFRYGNLNKELQNGSFLGRDKYPTTYGGGYELLVLKSGRYQSNENGGNI